MSARILELFFADTDEVDEPLPPEQQAALLDTYRAGGSDAAQARQQLIEHNLRLVIYIAKRYQHNGLPLEDLIQEGTIGLMVAIDKYDPDRGAFSTCATWWVRHQISRAVNHHARTIRIPEHAYLHLRRVQFARDDLFQSLGREPTLGELAEATDIAPEWIEHLQTISSSTSLDLEDDDGNPFYRARLADEEPAPEDLIAQQELWDDVLSGVEAIPDPRHRYIIQRYYGLDGQGGCSGSVIGREYGCTRSRIHQMRREALDELQYAIPAAHLETYHACDCTDPPPVSFYT